MAARDDILNPDLLDDSFITTEVIENFIVGTYGTGDNSVYGGYGNRSRQPRPAKSIKDFFYVINEALENKYEVESIIPADRPIYTENNPPYDLETEAISFGVIARYPATFGGPPFAGKRQELKPRIRSIDNDPDNPNAKLYTLGQQFENKVSFTCWAKTNKAANDRALWFENFMVENAWFLKYSGINECIFLERGADIILDLDGKSNTLFGRPLVYYVRTERLTHLSEPMIKKIIIKYGIGDKSIKGGI